MRTLVSIIVPVYNAENNLCRCIESILNQSYKDFELILLDDGSTDASGLICDDYAMKDERIIVVHKENSGVSDTRNQGLDLAKGEYIQFLDSDDWITPDATGIFVSTAQEKRCEMVIADFYRVIGERVAQKGAIDEDGLMNQIAFAENMMQKPADFYYGVLWNKLYKKSIIEEHNLRMDSSVSWCEDFMFNLEYIRYVKFVYALKVPVYYYVKTKGSLVSQGISMKKTIQMKRRVFAYYNDFYKDVFGEDDYEKRKLQVFRFLVDAASDGLVSPAILPGNYKLGNERTSVSEGVQEGEGTFFELYRERKLQDRLLEVAALRNDLTTVDVKVLLYYGQIREKCTFREIAEILGITRGSLTLSIQRLLARGLIEAYAVTSDDMENDSEKKSAGKEFVTTSEAVQIFAELMIVLDDFDQIQFEGFTQDELELFDKLNERRKNNIRRELR